MIKNSRPWWLLFAIAVFFTFLGQRGLHEPDEGRYASIAREMVADGNWLVPHMNGNPHFQKPPIIYWFTGLSLKAFGNHEWSARLPSALMGLGTVTLAFLITRRLRPQLDKPVITALILTTIAGYFVMSRLLTPDMTMTFWITAAITAAIYERHWLYFICMGIGFLTKGPMALVVPLFAVIGWQYFASSEEKLRLPWVRGMLLTLAISISWFTAVSLRDAQLFEYFWKYELIERFGSSSHGRSKPFWFFALVLPLGLLPWVFFLPIRTAWKKICSRKLNAHDGLLLGWTIPPLLILSLSGSKLPTYILPLMPAFAIGIAATLPSVSKAWKIAIPTALIMLVGDFVVSRNNDLLGVQCSTRELVDAMNQNEPDADSAILFACGTRTQGLAFYAEHILNITREEADLAITPTEDQARRIYSSPGQCVRKLTDGPKAHGIVRDTRFKKLFDPAKWRIIARTGPFLLVANHPRHVAECTPLQKKRAEGFTSARW